jgi:hypothetical protein
MAMTEVEKSSRSIMERTFYTKLGPTPGLPPSRGDRAGQAGDEVIPNQAFLPAHRCLVGLGLKANK